jgi:hypothetical protein
MAIKKRMALPDRGRFRSPHNYCREFAMRTRQKANTRKAANSSQIGGFDGRTLHPIYGNNGNRRKSAESFQVLNKSGPPGHGEAQLQYLDGDFRVVSPGTFVRCAVTDARIPLDELKYWSVDLQEAYAQPVAVLQRHYPGALKRQD